MKLKKLDVRGFAHDIALVGIVVIFAIGGVAYLVASHADSCDSPASGPVSSSVSDSVSDSVSSSVSGSCQAASGPVSSSVSTPGVTPPAPTPTPTPPTPKPTPTKLAAICHIIDVPTKPYYREQINPYVVITNTGTQSFAPSGISNIETFGASGDLGGKGGPFASSTLYPGQSRIASTGTHYTTPLSSSSALRLVFSLTSTSPQFTCAATATLPTH